MSFDAPLLRIRAAVRILKGEFQMKQYQKPEVIYENFVLAEHIARCDYKLGLADVGTCKIEADRVSNDIDYADWTNTFIDQNDQCTTKSEKYCYTNGSGLLSLFQS